MDSDHSDFNFSNSSTESPDNSNPFTIPPSTFIWVVVSVAIVSMTSQAAVILIAFGLKGDFSAQTIMIVQSVSEILKMAQIVQRAVCGLSGKNSIIKNYT